MRNKSLTIKIVVFLVVFALLFSASAVGDVLQIISLYVTRNS